MTAPTYLHRRRWRTVTVTSPAAGANWVLTPPGGRALRVVSLVARLVTSAVAGSRRVTLIADNGEKIWFAQSASADQIASQTVDYAAHTGATASGVVPGTLNIPLPSGGLLLESGHRLRVSVAGLDPGDQWSAIQVRADEYTSSDAIVGDATDETPRDHPE